MLSNWSKEKKLETVFLFVFSGVIIVLLYLIMSLNGLVLGNDSAVHLAKAQLFLKTGNVPINSVGWIPPLFEIMLSIIISFSGATKDVAQMVFLVKALAVLVNLLLFLSVYLVSSKFFNKKIGALSAVFLAMCFPTYELNTWGGYTTVLGLAFLLLLFYYSYLAAKQLRYVVVTFFVVFAIVLNHQLTAFLAAVIMLPVMLLTLIKFKGAYLIGVIAIFLGGAVAFFAYYFQPILEYLDVFIYHIFFGNKAYVVQIPFTNFQSFMLYFGFLQFLAIGGLIISYYWLKQQNKQILFVTLMLSLFIPFFFAQSHLFGFLLPFEWFTYYLTPPIAILAAVFVVFVAKKIPVLFSVNRFNLQKKWIKTTAFFLILTICVPVVVFHVDNTYNRIILAAKHNATSDLDAYEAAVWLNQSYSNSSTVVVTQKPGDWFGIFSGKPVISQTLDWVGRTPIADSVLSLDYELQGTQTMAKAYEINNQITDELYVLINLIWERVSFSSTDADFLSFALNGVNHRYALSDMKRTISHDCLNNPKIEFRYFNNHVELTQTIQMENSSYFINVSWDVTALTGNLSNITLYLTTFLDLNFHFDVVHVPNLMNWVNPWDAPSKNVNGNEWAAVDFSNLDLAEHYAGIYDQHNQTGFAFYFTDVPDWANIGALSNYEIDAVRYQYCFDQIGINQTVTRKYQMLTLTQNNHPTLHPDDLQNFFKTNSEEFAVLIHNYKEYIAQNDIRFLVYDKNQTKPFSSFPLSSRFLPQLRACPFLELVYSNTRYEVFKILDNYNQTHIWE